MYLTDKFIKIELAKSQYFHAARLFSLIVQKLQTFMMALVHSLPIFINLYAKLFEL